MADFKTMRESYALDFTWDVRNHVPPHQDAQGNVNRTDTDDEEHDQPVQEVYNRINMMTFVLEGIPFEVFLGEPVLTWIDHAIYKVAHQGRWPGRVAPNGTPTDDEDPYRRAAPRKDHEHFPDFPNDQQPNQHDSELRKLILRQLEAVKTAASRPGNDEPPVRLRSLWEVDVDAPGIDSRLMGVYTALKTLRDDSDHGHRFCMSFVAIQESDPIQLVPTHVMDAFISTLTGVTHYDVYTKSVKYFPRIRTGIELGKNYFIFEAPGSRLPGGLLLGGGGPNNRICHAGLSTCITETGSSCTTDSNGYCTAG